MRVVLHVLERKLFAVHHHFVGEFRLLLSGCARIPALAPHRIFTRALRVLEPHQVLTEFQKRCDDRRKLGFRAPSHRDQLFPAYFGLVLPRGEIKRRCGVRAI